MLGFLRSTVEENASVDTADMKPLKKNLGSLGYYRPTEGVDLHDYPDEPLFKGIRKFQKDEGLKVDGVMKPGGPTENRLVRKLSERRGRSSGPDDGTRPPAPDSYDDIATRLRHDVRSRFPGPGLKPGPDPSEGDDRNWIEKGFSTVSGWLGSGAPPEPPKYDAGGGRRDPGTLSPGIYYRPKRPKKPNSPRTNPHPPNRLKPGKPMI
jgi:hypothetical protein